MYQTTQAFQHRAQMGDFVPGKVLYLVEPPIQKIERVRVQDYPQPHGEGWPYKVSLSRIVDHGYTEPAREYFLSDLSVDYRHDGSNAVFVNLEDALAYACVYFQNTHLVAEIQRIAGMTPRSNTDGLKYGLEGAVYEELFRILNHKDSYTHNV